MLSAVLVGFVERQVGMSSVLRVRPVCHLQMCWAACTYPGVHGACWLQVVLSITVLEARALLCSSSWPVTLDASVSTGELSVGRASMSRFIFILNFLLGMVVQCRVLCGRL